MIPHVLRTAVAALAAVLLGSAGQVNTVLGSGTIDPDSYGYPRNIRIDAKAGQNSVWLDVTGFENVFWTVAIHAGPMVEARAGWD